jgi:hypothetical protein
MQPLKGTKSPDFSLFSCQGKNTNYFIFFSIIWQKNLKNRQFSLDFGKKPEP